MKIKFIITFLFLSFKTFALAKGLLVVTPIFGVEKTYKSSPFFKEKTRTYYGLRALLGPRFLRLEGELTQSKDDESLPEQNLTEEEKSTQAKLGIRSGFSAGPLGFYLRAGGNARKREFTTVQDGVTTTRGGAIKTSPYAGAGASLSAGGFFIDANITAVFSGEPKGSDYDTQSSLGIGFRF